MDNKERTINFNIFRQTWLAHIEYNRNKITQEDLNEIIHKAYIGYKNWCKDLYKTTIQNWITIFYEDFNIDSHNICLKSKLKGLKDLALKNKN